MKRALILTAILALALVGCSGKKPNPTLTPTQSSSRPSSTGHIEILAPLPGAIVKGSETIVKVKLTGAHIVKAASTNLKPDEGHIHVKLDGVTKTLLANLEYNLTGLTPGPHLLEVEFAASDHGPFEPRVLEQSSFTDE